MHKWPFFILISLLFTACADLNKSEQLSRIDSMEAEVAEWNDVIDAYDSAAWLKRLTEVEETMEALKQIQSDTISLEQALAMDTYKNLQLEMTTVHPLLTRSDAGLSDLAKRLKKLKKDIESGNGQRHKYDSYLTAEEAQFKILDDDLALFVSIREKVESDLPNAQNEVNTILDEHLLQ